MPPGSSHKKEEAKVSDVKTFKYTLGDREISMTFGKFAKQASGAVLVESGETAVLVTATMSKNPRDLDFFPLLVDYEEKHYAVGRVPGSFMRREGRASEQAILSGRLIDRSIRPLFPEGFRNDIQVVCYTLSSDQQVEPDMLAMVGASAALMVSNIPFAGPCCGVRVGRIEGNWLINPTFHETEESDIDLVVAGTSDAIMMVEAGIKIVPEDEVLDAIGVGFAAVQELNAWQIEIAKQIGKEKLEVKIVETDPKLYAWIEKNGLDRLTKAIQNSDKKLREAATDEVLADLGTQLANLPDDHELKEMLTSKPKLIADALYHLEKKVVRKLTTEKGVRVDGRKTSEIRPISCEVGILPRTHGTGLFTRGQTQVLNVCTLGSTGDAQKIDGLDPITSKRYMHHYNFPGFSVGEVKPSRGPGRREIGHGALAERALHPVLPDPMEFPYSLRLVSEVLESNGSTSMASTCGSTLSLMDAGVPIKAPVAGIAMGLIKEGDRFAVLTDIQGIEDHLGDMDFKVAGTHEGITALQMDIKIKGISLEIMQVALEQARQARMFILDKMTEAISEPRSDLSPYAPRIITLHINPEKIGTLIGPGGKMIKRIVEETGVKIDVEDDGSVFITTPDSEAAAAAVSWVERLTKEAEVGKVYTGRVTRILNFGAFVEILPGKEGLVHISQLAPTRVAKVEDVVNIGDVITVKVVEIDSQGRINLTKKGVRPEEEPAANGGAKQPAGAAN
ncbi:MAG: polyribonucleotide nucleotidyltransferase [Candidatus Sericytochromatia bacterium]|nr:polyribonucleotide nucleotidyltransferase [Candidatus Tanganyikabacteria bacterium]